MHEVTSIAVVILNALLAYAEIFRTVITRKDGVFTAGSTCSSLIYK